MKGEITTGFICILTVHTFKRKRATSSLTILRTIERNWLKLQHENVYCLKCYKGRHRGNPLTMKGVMQQDSCGNLSECCYSLDKHRNCGSISWLCFQRICRSRCCLGYPPSSTLLACSNAVADRGNEPLLTSSFCLCLGQSTHLALLIQFLAVSTCSTTKPLTTCKLLPSGTGMHHLGTFLQTISSWHSA